MIITHVGGPTAMINYAGLAILTDPTFDPPGDHRVNNTRSLTKLTGPAMPPDRLGHLDLVLLSHDQHPDNLDTLGRELLPTAELVLSTPAAAQRIDAVTAIEPWQSRRVGTVRVTAVPARHGAPGMETIAGPVTGFILRAAGWPTVYISGDNASVGIAEEIAERFSIEVALLFCGAARMPGETTPLTLTAADAVLVARAMPAATVVPLHSEGWLHFTESPGTLATAFAAAGIADRLLIPLPGRPLPVG